LGGQRQPSGDLNGMPAFLGCSDRDPHIPLQRVNETTALLEAMGAKVTEYIYPNMGHTIIEDEIDQARQVISESL
jgi:phospholipase/carboxylesterase